MDPNGIGMKLLKNMGYQPGKGLGKYESGIKEPVELNKSERKGVGLGFKQQAKIDHPLINKIQHLISLTRDEISKEKEQNEKLKNELYRINIEKSCEILPLYLRIKSQFDQYGLKFLDKFTVSELEVASEFVIALLDQVVRSKLTNHWDPVCDKDLLFLWEKCHFLKQSHLTLLIVNFLVKYTEENWHDIFKWTSVLMEWKFAFNDQIYNYNFYPFVLSKAKEVIAEFQINLFFPLLALENDTHSVEMMLMESLVESNYICSVQEASVLQSFLSEDYYWQLVYISLNRLLEMDIGEIVKWHDFIGCQSFDAICVDSFFPSFRFRLENLFNENNYKEFVDFYQSWRSNFPSCCIKNESFRFQFYQILCQVNNGID